MSAGWDPCLMVITRNLRRPSSAASATRKVVFPAFLRPMIEIIRVAEAAHFLEGEDTDPHVAVEGDRLEVSGIQPPLDGETARRSVHGAERLDPSAAVALREKRIPPRGAGGQGAEQAFIHEGHVPGDAQHRPGACPSW